MLAHLPLLDGASVNDLADPGRLPPLAEHRLPARLRAVLGLRVGANPGRRLCLLALRAPRARPQRGALPPCGGGRGDAGAVRPAAPLPDHPSPRRRHGRHGLARFRRHGRRHRSAHPSGGISRGLEGQRTGRPDCLRAGRSARRRALAGLQLLRPGRGPAQPGLVRASSTTSATPPASACPTSTWVTGSRAATRWTTRPASARWSCCVRAAAKPACKIEAPRPRLRILRARVFAEKRS